MPLPVNQLTADSHDADIQDAISESIRICMEEGGKDQKECAGMVYGIARDQTGKDLNYGGAPARQV